MSTSTTRAWQEKGVRRVVEYLAESSQPLHYKQIVERLREEYHPSGEDLVKATNGTERWANLILWGTSDVVAAGWLTKRDGVWAVTAEGRAALAKYPTGAEFLDAGKKLYRQWREESKAPSRRAWLLRGSSVLGVNLVAEWLTQGFVSLAASHLPPVGSDASLEQLEEAIAAGYGHLKHFELKSKRDEIVAFVRAIKPGHVVMTANDSAVHVGDVTGDWTYSESEGGRANLQRTVEWRNPEDPIDFGDLPAPLPARLASPSAVVDLTEDLDLIDVLATSEPASVGPVIRHERLSTPDAPFANKLLVGHEWLADVVDLLNERRQLIFYGPPGTGKTFIARAIAHEVTGGQERVRLVQFHPSYTYEDFFEGYRPAQATTNGMLSFELRAGPLRQIVKQAQEHRDQAFVLIIDEINRANLAKVFGELYFLLEYRDEAVDLLYSPEDNRFTLPPNLYLIGTMNTADRSIALVDSAMRRRFAFVALDPSVDPTKSMLRKWLADEGLEPTAALLLDELNRRIEDPDLRIGPSYFMKSKDHSEAKLERVWRTSIIPLLEEHHYGEWASVASRYAFGSLMAAITPYLTS